MNITIQKNTNFTSRNATIRRADDIARVAKNAFPMISSSKIDTFKNVSLFKSFLLKISKDLNEERFRRGDRIDSYKSIAGKEYNLMFDFAEAKTEKIKIIKRRETLYDSFLENNFPKSDEDVIKKIYPELILNKR